MIQYQISQPMGNFKEEQPFRSDTVWTKGTVPLDAQVDHVGYEFSGSGHDLGQGHSL